GTSVGTPTGTAGSAVVLATSPTITNETVNQASNGTTALTGKRATDSSPTGNFINFTNFAGGTNLFTVDAAGNVTGTKFTGDGSGLTNVTSTNFSGNLAGDVTGPQGTTVVANVGGVTAANVASGANAANAATNANTASTIVKRDASGNFAAGTITAALTGNVTGNATTATTATNFSGNLAGDVTGPQGTT